MSQIPSFLGVKMTSYVKILGKWSKNFITKKFDKLFQRGLYGWICLKKSLKGSKWLKYAFFGVFPLFLSILPIDRLIYTNIVTDPPSFHFHGPNQGFSEALYIPLHNYNSGYDGPPPRFWWVVSSNFWLNADETVYMFFVVIFTVIFIIFSGRQ